MWRVCSVSTNYEISDWFYRCFQDCILSLMKQITSGESTGASIGICASLMMVVDQN